MSVITQLRSQNNNTRTQEVSEFDGLWINAGINVSSEQENAAGEIEKVVEFVRLPRGIAVSDLNLRRVYDNMSDDFRANVELANELIRLIQEKASALGEGESVPIKLELQLYRKVSESTATKPGPKTEGLAAALFG